MIHTTDINNNSSNNKKEEERRTEHPNDPTTQNAYYTRQKKREKKKQWKKKNNLTKWSKKVRQLHIAIYSQFIYVACYVESFVFKSSMRMKNCVCVCVRVYLFLIPAGHLNGVIQSFTHSLIHNALSTCFRAHPVTYVPENGNTIPLWPKTQYRIVHGIYLATYIIYE